MYSNYCERHIITTLQLNMLVTKMLNLLLPGRGAGTEPYGGGAAYPVG